MEYNNILIIKMSSIGDILHALPFAQALRERYPKAKITWLVHPQFAGFVPDPPIIDEVIYFDKVAFNKMTFGEKWHFIKEFRSELRSKNFDLVVDLQGLFKSAAVAFLTGCSDKIGYCEMREGSGLISTAIKGEHAKDHVIERYLDVARYLGAEIREVKFPMPKLTEEWKTISAVLEKAGIKMVRPFKKIGVTGHFLPVVDLTGPLQPAPYIVMVPGARWETKKWPPEHFAKLARYLIEDGYYVVLAGGKEDIRQGEIIRELANFPKEIIDLIGKTNLREVAALIKNCTFYISADTGPLHIATAFQKPLIALYGPTKPDRTGPYGDKDAVLVVAREECAGCLKKQCNHWHCMYRITPEKVYDTFRKKMEAQNG